MRSWWCIVHCASGQYRPLLATHLISVHKCFPYVCVYEAGSLRMRTIKAGKAAWSETSREVDDGGRGGGGGGVVACMRTIRLPSLYKSLDDRRVRGGS